MREIRLIIPHVCSGFFKIWYDTRRNQQYFVTRKAEWLEQEIILHFKGRLRLKCDGTRAETRFRLSAKRTSLFNPLNPELNPICYLLALLRAHHFLHVSRIRVKLLTFRLLMSYIYIYRAPILDVSRSHTTTQHIR